jgi:hypothetical protein
MDTLMALVLFGSIDFFLLFGSIDSIGSKQIDNFRFFLLFGSIDSIGSKEIGNQVELRLGHKRLGRCHTHA